MSVKENLINITILITSVAAMFAMMMYLRGSRTSEHENLSLSQRMPYKEDCSSLIKPPAPVMSPYPKGTKIACNVPGDKRLRLKNCDFYKTFSNERNCAGCGGCSSCKSNPVLYPRDTCFNTLKSTENPTTVKFPPISNETDVISITSIDKLNSHKINNHLENGDLIISGKNMNVINYLLHKLKYLGGNGYPDFYNVDGPVTVLTKDGKNYHYMIDYPIKYTPENIEKYVNTTVYSDYIMDAWRAGSRMQESCNPVVILTNGKSSKDCNPIHPKTIDAECCKSVWGAPYGCGNWTRRV